MFQIKQMLCLTPQMCMKTVRKTNAVLSHKIFIGDIEPNYEEMIELMKSKDLM